MSRPVQNVCIRCGRTYTARWDDQSTACRDCRSVAPLPESRPLGRQVEPHPDGDRLADEAVQRAQRLACAVRDDGAYEVARITDPLARDELVALCVALAAMVPVDQPVSRLLAWIDQPLPEGQRFPALHWSEASMRMAHRDYNAGRRDQWAVEGERAYQKAHPRQRGRAA